MIPNALTAFHVVLSMIGISSGVVAILPTDAITPGAHNHFARTDKDTVIVQISGYGPTDTRHFNPADEPKPHNKF